MGIRVEGEKVPRPLKLFKHLQVDETIMQQIIKMGYKEPTPI